MRYLRYALIEMCVFAMFPSLNINIR